MFKVFKNRMYLYIFTAFILCFIQTIESHGNIIKNRFQEQERAPIAVIAATGKNTVIEAVEVVKAIDMAVVRDSEGQDGLAFGKTEKVSLFTAFWGGVGFISVLSSLLSSDLIGVVASLIGLFL
ncbi:hypothetical protein ME1_01402 [Bartonella vinsonii subsp. arupensis OK-94-513]|uniref:Uncharacterized protein n=2 Tax=Bartonella vinsonii subsp. arupensis TaxID=110578 RepID=J0QTX1_BARVI|nr:hypothetical protein [Bartonella vinsonii]EJF86564.1 hypothetical protein ME1_01402 [Bartonella vinsonii subsp. arupensis OK-94-513]EJF97881.1 hypothetical protein MEI_01067 [Bartonella vinsonii subsp. arupensis Pm136co]